MLNGPALFFQNLFMINAALVPALVGLTCARRFVRSEGFNRLVYGYMAAFSWCMVYLVVETSPESGTLGAVIVIGAWMTLPLWLCVRDLTRTMPTRLRRRLALTAR